MSLNLAIPLREAIIANVAVSGQLAQWEGEPAVFTRLPVPADAPYPFVLISADISMGDQDSLVTRRPLVRRDLLIYGLQPDHYRLVEDLGYLLRTQFHRQRFALSVPGYGVTDIVAQGPVVAPTDSEQEVARVVPLQVRLQDLST